MDRSRTTHYSYKMLFRAPCLVAGNTLTTGTDWNGVHIDHIDHNRSNNDVTNLRIVQQGGPEGNAQGSWHGYNHY
jgi:hypothetical protein